ncbi:phage head-tail connector protein [Enterococcus faecium]|nr:phage head-tail connector protein [Enterococcus faecium]
MNTQILELLKVNLGIMTDKRNDYLLSIIDSVISELESEQGIIINNNDDLHIMFIVDYSAWRYRSRGEGVMPRNLQFRLHNLVLSMKKG